MEDDLLQRGAAVRDDQESPSRPSRDERFFDRATPRDEFLVRTECVGWWKGRRSWRRTLVERPPVGIAPIRVATALVGRAPLSIAVAFRVPIAILVTLMVAGKWGSLDRRAVEWAR